MVFASTLLVAFTNFAAISSFRDLQPPNTDWHKQGDSLQSHDVVVDLGYEIYAGVANDSTRLNVFKGIRFATPPIGPLRWQASQPPVINRSATMKANAFGAACPHGLRSGQTNRALPSPISEDCLFLNVWAPQNGSDLPVFVNIHGGGYGVGDGREDLSKLINANGNGFVGVNIQYRLGAFGFLAGDEVYRNGVVNAGLLDQQLALQWVQDHIEKFGGDRKKVTIFGISAGGGSVMLHNMAYSGSQDTSLFSNSISFSPYLPQQHDYNDWIPSQAYYAFAIQAGCAPVWAYGNVSQTIFQCLVSKDSATLQAASASVSRSGPYGTWAFLPVTDGDLIQSTPSKALTSDRLNGRAHLTSNVAEEAFIFVPRTIHTAEDLTAWIKLLFPSFNFRDILFHYPYQNTSAQPKFATSGLTTPTALQTSSTSTSYQQLANLIYAEATFMCPSYWLAQAFNTGERKGWKMQYSVPVALHGYDGIALVGNTRLPIHSDDFILALQKIIGNFVVNADPGFRPFKAPDWPMMNLNQTGGMEVDVSSTLDLGLNGTGAKWNIGPGLKNNFEIVNGSEWEGGRGVRCEFWRGLGLEGMSL